MISNSLIFVTRNLSTSNSFTRIKSSSLLLNYYSFNSSTASRSIMTKALVLGTYQKQQDDGSTTSVKVLTEAASTFDKQLSGKLTQLINQFGPNKRNNSKVFYGLHQDYPVVSVVGLGPQDAGYNSEENIDERREFVRQAMAVGAKSVANETDVTEVHIDPCHDAEASAEGANLALWNFDETKAEKYKKKRVTVEMCSIGSDAAAKEAFERGTLLANAQNVCRRLAETPANLMTPTIFSQNAVDLLKQFPKVKVIVRDRKWAEEKKMGSFLSVANGSDEPCKFLELHYNNKPDSKPYAMVGKGICFDSGGISLKPGSNMDKMRSDMMGAANIVATVYALAALDAKVNVIGLTPLTENMPSGKATKPGDVVTAMNGKTIQVDNTDAEGRLVLADALCYAHEFEPEAIFDIATLTGAIMVALGPPCFAVFATDAQVYESFRQAGAHTGDRPWRMPLFSYYKGQVTDARCADLLNIAKTPAQAGSCTAAAFLHEFVKCPKWAHLDIAGVMETPDTEAPYHVKAMSGRPVRTLVYAMENHFKSK